MDTEKRKSSLPSYLNSLQSAGQVIFSRKNALQELGISQGAFLDSAGRLQKQGRLISPRQGFYIVVPPQYLGWGAPPPSWYIDDLMRHEGHPYYVGLLKAAELHGAAHQAVMEFQVITDKRLPQMSAGRAVLSFYYRKDIAGCEIGIKDYKTDTGSMKISCVELTAFDLLRYPHAAGGLDNIATILSDLGNKISPEKLSALAPAFERAVIQRVGWLLDRLGHKERAERLHDYISGISPLSWVELEPASAKKSNFSSEPLEENKRWNIIVRRYPEMDE